jgi:gas vesicle protein
MEDSTKNILIAAGSGIAVGAILGVLFAPSSGEETRERIATKAHDAKDTLLEKKDEIAENIIGLQGKMKTLFKDTKNLTKEELESKIKELEEIIKTA